MSRPKRPSPEKWVRVYLEVYYTEKKEIEYIAGQLGMTKSDFIRAAISQHLGKMTHALERIKRDKVNA